MSAVASEKIVWRGSFRRWRAVLGPTAILASLSMGPGTIGSTIASGATLGYQITWLLLLAIAWKVVMLYMVGKTTCITGLSVLDQYARYFHRSVAWFAGGLLLLLTLPITMLTAVVLSHALVFLVPVLSTWMALIVCFAAIAYLYVLRSSFSWVKTVCAVFVTFMSLTFVVNAWMVEPDLGALIGGLVPRLPAGREGTMLFTGVLASTISIVTVVFFGYVVRYAGWTVRDVPVMTWDVGMFSGLLLSVFSLAVYVSGTALLGQPVGEAVEVAVALEPVAGPAAKWIFAVGFFTAVFTTTAVACYVPGYVLHDFFRWKLDGDLHLDPTFRIICLVTLSSIFLAPLVSHVLPPITLVVFATALFILGTPPIILLSLILALRRDVMGEHQVGRPVAVLVAGLLGFSTWSVWVFVVRVMSDLW